MLVRTLALLLLLSALGGCSIAAHSFADGFSTGNPNAGGANGR